MPQLSFAFFPSWLVTGVVFFFMLSILVLIHELGHFLTAKRFGIKVEEFGFGLPPRIFGIKRGETIYSINWLPIGGFVRMFGEDEDPTKKVKGELAHRTFYGRPIWQRVIVLCAGVVMNLVLSIAIVSYLYTQGVQVPVGRVKVIEIVENSPAAAVGLQVGDIIKQIEIKNDTEDKTIEIKTSETLGKTVKDYLGQRILLTIDHSGKESQIAITPRKEFPNNEGPMGIAISDSEKKVYSIWEAPIVGTKESFQRTQAIISGIVGTVVKLVSGKSVGGDVGGPIQIAKMTGEVRRLGILPFLDFMGLISLNLAIINILPFPALDGGRLFFVIVEGIVGKKVKPVFEQYAHLIGMAVLILMIVLISINDVIRLVSGK